jgi:diacylglycerol kinase (ATP)
VLHDAADVARTPFNLRSVRSPVHLIVNPNARSGRGAALVPALEAALEAAGFRGWTRYNTTAPGDATRYARTLAVSGVPPGPVVVVGGDGTLHEVANGLWQAGFPEGYPLTVLPVGTGNDFHRMLRAGSGIPDLIHTLENGEVRRFDVGEVRGDGGASIFVNLMGVGIDEAVLRRRDRFRRLPGLVQYLAALLVTLVDYRPISLTGRWTPGAGAATSLPERWKTLLTAVTVGPSIGGGFIVAPDAQADDGLLDLILVEPLSVSEIARILPTVIRGTLKATSRIHLVQVTEGRIEAQAEDGLIFFELDGERMEQGTSWIEVRVIPGALPVLDHRAGALAPGVLGTYGTGAVGS